MELKEGLGPSLPSPSDSEVPFGGGGAELTRHVFVPSNAQPVLMGNLLKYLTFARVGKLAVSS